MSKKKITFKVTFVGGAGNITFSAVDGLNADKKLSSNQDTPIDEQSFDAEQSTGAQRMNVGGEAPSGGYINVDVMDGEKALKSVQFNDDEFDGEAISYEVEE